MHFSLLPIAPHITQQVKENVNLQYVQLKNTKSNNYLKWYLLKSETSQAQQLVIFWAHSYNLPLTSSPGDKPVSFFVAFDGSTTISIKMQTWPRCCIWSGKMVFIDLKSRLCTYGNNTRKVMVHVIFLTEFRSGLQLLSSGISFQFWSINNVLGFPSEVLSKH